MSCRENASVNCSQCGQDVHCGIQAGNSTCWCFDLPHVMKVDAATGCLCQECLTAAIKQQGDNPQPDNFYSKSKQLSQYR